MNPFILKVKNKNENKTSRDDIRSDFLVRKRERERKRNFIELYFR